MDNPFGFLNGRLALFVGCGERSARTSLTPDRWKAVAQRVIFRGMENTTYTGFRFSHSRPDMNVPSGKLTVHILAIARDREEAERLAADLLPAQGLQFLSSGDDDLRSRLPIHAENHPTR